MSGKALDCVEIDPTGSEIGKHDFRPMPTEPIIHGPGRIPLVALERTAEARERYYSEKITELAITQQELGRVARERNALVKTLERIAAGGLPGGAQGFAADILAKLEAGELRKPVG